MITATILTKNSSATLAAALESLKKFPEVLVVDTGSTDSTLEMARAYPNVRVAERPFDGFGKLHNLASELAAHDWILSVDSDEIVSPELADEILFSKLDPKSVYSLDRHNYFQGKRMKCCSGWHPDPVVRLFHRRETRFSDAAVHEKVIVGALRLVPLRGGLMHVPYRNIDDFLSKMQLYSSLFAEQNVGKKSTLGKALLHGFTAFIKSYFFKRGFLGGKEGFIISLYNSHTAYYKYLKLAYEPRPKGRGL